jgi:CheY-like chemotaxis protein
MPYAKVLMVDDVLTNLDVAKGMLKPYGMQVDCVTSGHQAIALIREEHTRYDAIFMDHMMPGMDGIEAVRIIREEIGTEYAKTVKIIALTANAIIGNEKMFLEHGFQAFLSKPIDIMRLDCTLKQWVRDKNLEKKFLEESNVLPESSEADNRDSRSDLEWHIEGLDLGKLLERFGGDEESLIHTLASYRETTPALLEKLRSLTEKGLGEYAIVVHGVKGSSYGICAETVGRLAEELEYASKNGDFEFVDKNNGALLRFAEKLIADIGVMLEGVNQLDKKPKRETPDSVVLNLLRESCVNYDMDGIDRAMQELESFEYEAQGGLVTWLRERVDAMDLLQIQDRLSA